MIINGKKLLELAPIKDMLDHSEIANGVSYGLSESGYDIRCANDIVFKPKEHNGRFRLDVSMEEFQMPDNLLGSVCDKSTFARAGVSVKNTKIKPGWRGHLTIELFYEKDDDFTIKAGTSVCQIIFEETYESVAYNGIYQDQGSDPEVYRLYPRQEKALKECISSSPLEESTLSDKPLIDMTREELHVWIGKAMSPTKCHTLKDVRLSKETPLNCDCEKDPEEISTNREKKIRKIFWILDLDREIWSKIYASYSDEYIDSKLEALNWLYNNTESIALEDGFHRWLDETSELLIHKGPKSLGRLWECTKYVDKHHPSDYKILEKLCMSRIDLWRESVHGHGISEFPKKDWTVRLALGYFTYRWVVVEIPFLLEIDRYSSITDLLNGIYNIFKGDIDRAHYLEKLAEMDSEYL